MKGQTLYDERYLWQLPLGPGAVGAVVIRPALLVDVL